MRVAVAALLLSLVVTPGSCARRSRHFRVILGGMNNIHLSFGSEQLQQVLRLDTKTAHFAVLDVACRNPRELAECPRLCDDVKLCRLFCSPLCEKFTEANQSNRCAEDTDYNATESTTFRDLDENIFVPFKDFRPLIGRRAREDFSFMTHRTRKAVEWEDMGFGVLNIVNVTNFGFVRGLSFHTSYLGYKTGVVGLAPRSSDGHLSLVPQLKKMGYLDRAIISLQKTRDPIFNSSFAMDDETILFGALDKFACRWDYFPQSDNGWTFPMTDLIFAGVPIPGPHFGRIAIEHFDFRIPDSVAKHFIAAGFLIKIDGSNALKVANRSALGLEFASGGARVRLGADALMNQNLTVMAAGDAVRYADEVQWSFGWFLLLKGFCLGFDYDAGRVAWGVRREILSK